MKSRTPWRERLDRGHAASTRLVAGVIWLTAVASAPADAQTVDVVLAYDRSESITARDAAQPADSQRLIRSAPMDHLGALTMLHFAACARVVFDDDRPGAAQRFLAVAPPLVGSTLPSPGGAECGEKTALDRMRTNFDSAFDELGVVLSKRPTPTRTQLWFFSDGKQDIDGTCRTLACQTPHFRRLVARLSEQQRRLLTVVLAYPAQHGESPIAAAWARELRALGVEFAFVWQLSAMLPEVFSRTTDPRHRLVLQLTCDVIADNPRRVETVLTQLGDDDDVEFEFEASGFHPVQEPGGASSSTWRGTLGRGHDPAMREWHWGHENQDLSFFRGHVQVTRASYGWREWLATSARCVQDPRVEVIGADLIQWPWSNQSTFNVRIQAGPEFAAIDESRLILMPLLASAGCPSGGTAGYLLPPAPLLGAC